jgi:hypothetical protein
VSQDPGASARRYALEFMLITGVILLVYLLLFGGAGRILDTISGATPTPSTLVSPPASPTTSP